MGGDPAHQHGRLRGAPAVAADDVDLVAVGGEARVDDRERGGLASRARRPSRTSRACRRRRSSRRGRWGPPDPSRSSRRRRSSASPTTIVEANVTAEGSWDSADFFFEVEAGGLADPDREHVARRARDLAADAIEGAAAGHDGEAPVPRPPSGTALLSKASGGAALQVPTPWEVHGAVSRVITDACRPASFSSTGRLGTPARKTWLHASALPE